jgi:RNA polymerase sigma-70 factor (ECF subfamily)
MKDWLKQKGFLKEKDENLVQKTLKGDNRAFTELVGRYYRLFISVAMGYTHELDLAEDMVQEGLVEMHRSLPNLREHAKFAAWGETIVRRKCLIYLGKVKTEAKALQEFGREENRVRELDEASQHQETLGPEDEKRIKIIKAVSGLPVKYREVSVLFYFDQLNAVEIAERLKITPELVQVRLFRARKMLKERLSRD